MKTKMFPIWRHFLNNTPIYLARHYWWAYLWRPSIWFFDHQPVINVILFTQYTKILDQTLLCLKKKTGGRFLQLTCVYGKLTPSLLQQLRGNIFSIVDISTEQLKACRNKLTIEENGNANFSKMNAEKLTLADNSFSTVLVFFLLHEMPHDARQRALSETVRVMEDNGRLVITEYGPLPTNHWLYRIFITRWIITYLEPFLDDFWHEDLESNLQEKAKKMNKSIKQIETHDIFGGFYRVNVFELKILPSED